MKVCWIDTETTGLDPYKNGVIQVAYLIEENGQIIGKDNLYIRPYEIDEIVDSALSVNHITREQLMSFSDPYESAKKLYNDLYEYTYKTKEKNKFDREHLYVAGHNVKFDYDFLDCFFKKSTAYQEINHPHENFNFSIKNIFDFHLIDTFAVTNFLKYCGVDFGTSHKLTALCEQFQIEFDAHDAMNDIEANYKLCHELKNRFLKIE